MTKKKTAGARPPPKTAKPKIGRPSQYHERYKDIAHAMALLGSTDVQLADALGVTLTTLTNWKKKYPDFLSSLKDGKTEADEAVVKSLYTRATGYSHKGVKIFCNADGEVTEVPFTERYPPDTTAMIFWLKNRRPAEWRDRRDLELSAHSSLVDLLTEIAAGDK